ncbi:sulfite exporter TauE/SafE family protein [Bermanella marisrubri]|uniref:Probable membrane transporter protein n=1 Tax=Bermanella marisrubri TaxID=207949 RepID=Q1MZB3_9GAMM|nr:sulfite exporter TauE/SafE family protein [Bermanella marisrubri]EAT11353.1 hypothetical protein RED65_13037 [Oceanobacter sp. RED65] [Bermanella marisrubri]QIZ85261.1 sulfite exporter TauE/SafE family protein [Bermanella marisrubri]
MTFDLVFWLLAILGVVLTGISKSGFAGGAGVVAVPLLALWIPVEQAIAIMLPVLIAMDLQAVHLYWRDINWRIFKPLIPAALLGITLASFLLNQLPENTMLLILAILSIGFALWQSLSRWFAKLHFQGFFWGSFSGITSTLLHAGGPPINMYLLTLGLPKRQWIAITCIFFAFMNWIKVIPYSLSGLWQWDGFFKSLLLLPIAYLGIYLGHKIQSLLSEKQFMFACRCLLLFSGVGLLIKAVW